MILLCYFCFKRKNYEMKKEKKNTTLVDRTLDHTSPQFYPGVYVALDTLLAYPVPTCDAERGSSGMKRLKTPLRSTMSDERLSSLAILHIHKYKNVDIDKVSCQIFPS